MTEDIKSMPPHVFAAKVTSFVRKRLSKPLNKAAAVGEDPNIVLFALMEAAFTIIDGNIEDRVKQSNTSKRCQTRSSKI